MALAPFRMGRKELYLPNVTVTLHRNEHLSPNHATFTVPLWFNKLDLRDYLFNVYSVRTVSIRSFIKLQPVTRGRPAPEHTSNSINDDRPGLHAPTNRRWHRPTSIKKMVVELERPFVWPRDPKDIPEEEGGGYGPWQHEEKSLYDKESEVQQKQMDPATRTTLPPAEEMRQRMREQAERLLQKKETWTPGKHVR
ncbi:hypothetical protein K431DRAFT_346224 [Polychaeton citri CBS 116435]|uniref:Large ribosomal subunit protein uL23m n=1 Tax=Polychaeton citri CBS 116435 TaxID=1314669 RepID=A0A9P4UQ74_9PEZI|nr:hypothetical protein K431DRAFT_346224 [Polychaeton citri CBS 116435]